MSSYKKWHYIFKKIKTGKMNVHRGGVVSSWLPWESSFGDEADHAILLRTVLISTAEKWKRKQNWAKEDVAAMG